MAICRDHAANVKRWQDGQMLLRWVAAGMGEATKQFRRVNGYLHLPALRTALEVTVTTVTFANEDPPDHSRARHQSSTGARDTPLLTRRGPPAAATGPCSSQKGVAQ